MNALITHSRRAVKSTGALRSLPVARSRSAVKAVATRKALDAVNAFYANRPAAPAHAPTPGLLF